MPRGSTAKTSSPGSLSRSRWYAAMLRKPLRGCRCWSRNCWRKVEMPDLPARIGVLTISDRASRGEYEDISGKAINDFLGRALRPNWVAVVRIIPDGTDGVAQALIEMVE